MSISFFRSTAAVAAVGAGLCFLGDSPASAQECYPPSDGCTTTTSTPNGAVLSATLSDTTVPLCPAATERTIDVSIAGFKSGSSGIVTIASVEQQIGTFTVPVSGGTTTSVTIPSTISLGSHTVFVRGTTPSGVAGTASQGITVLPCSTSGGGGGGRGGTGSTLARTGFYLVPACVIGLGLVAGGVALKRSGKRSKARTAA